MTDSSAKRFLHIEGIQNLRDIGGYVTRDGRTTRYKRLLRSGNLDKVPPDSQQQLIDYGVRYIIDVRDEWEQVSYRNVFTDVPAINYQNVPFIGDVYLKDEASLHYMDTTEKRSDVYTFILERCQPQIARIVQNAALLPENECGLIHCAAGKDRTGLVIALILGVLDVPAETIAQDFALSSQISAYLLNQWQSDKDDEQTRQHLQRQASATEDTMQEVLAWLNEKYGGAVGYLNLDDATMNALRRRLLEE